MKKTRIVALTSSFLIFALITLIIFLTIPEERLESSVFWLAWSFAIPVNFLAIATLSIYGTKSSDVEIVRLPIAMWIAFGFGGAYLFSGLLLMYFSVVDITFPIILITTISVFYIIAIIYSIFGAEYILGAQKATKQKVLYIKLLEADIMDAASKATSPASQAALRAIAESVRFSDPMSHPTLSSIESQISFTVSEINAALIQDGAADITALTAKCQALLEQRNNRCIILK